MTAPDAVYQLVEEFDKGSAAITTKRSCGILGLDRPNGRFYYGCMDNVQKTQVSFTVHMLFGFAIKRLDGWKEIAFDLGS